MHVMIGKVLTLYRQTFLIKLFNKFLVFISMYAKKIVCFFFFIAIAFSIPLVLKKITLGFKAGKIFYISKFSHLDKIIDEKISPEILEIMSKNFVFLDKGAQCYVFESLDQKYVLKLFRRNARVFKPKKPNDSINRFISSCEIAWKKIPNQTGVLYAHTYKTKDVFGRIYITNPLGESLNINLNDCIFVLQKKAQTFKNAIMKNVCALDDSSLRKKIESYFKHINARLEMSIENIDPDISTNFGFLNNDFLEIDIGNFQYKEFDFQNVKDQYFSLLKDWMEENCPEKLMLIEEWR